MLFTLALPVTPFFTLHFTVIEPAPNAAGFHKDGTYIIIPNPSQVSLTGFLILNPARPWLASTGCNTISPIASPAAACSLISPKEVPNTKLQQHITPR